MKRIIEDDNFTNVKDKDFSGDIAGYMPLQRQAGFIYDYPAAFLIAHELAHGAFNLRHTFSSDHFVAVQGSTDNLMDYRSGTDLWKHQWKLIQDPERLWFSFLQDDEEALYIIVDDKIKEAVVSWTETFNPPRRFKNKRNLYYVKTGVEKGRPNSLYYKMQDGSVIHQYTPRNSVEAILYYQIIVYDSSINEYIGTFPFYLSDHEDNCLSCDLTRINQIITSSTATLVGRYILPIEDIYILIEGEDFDGMEASRLAAGGFIVLEAVQAGKIVRMVRGARILGQSTNVTRRVVWTAGKQITRDAAIDIAAQFIINFVFEAIANPEANGQDIALKALSEVSVGSAAWGGLIGYTAMRGAVEQTAYDCAHRFLTSLENNSESLLIDAERGIISCITLVGIRFILSHMRATNAAKELANAFVDARQYDIIIDKLSEIITEDIVYNFIEALLDNGINKGIDVIWAR